VLSCAGGSTEDLLFRTLATSGTAAAAQIAPMTKLTMMEPWNSRTFHNAPTNVA
jgi:hypothetical protein